jgi:hypothetical protein
MTDMFEIKLKGIVHEMGKLVSNSQFWYGEYDYGLKLTNLADSPLSSDKLDHRRTSPTVIGQV